MSASSLYGTEARGMTDPLSKVKSNGLLDADGITLMESPIVQHVSFQPIGSRKPSEMMTSLQVPSAPALQGKRFESLNLI